MRVQVPERHCTFVYDQFVSADGLSSVPVVRLTGINEDVEDWLNRRAYHFSVEEINGNVWVDFLEDAASTDFRITWG